MLIKNYLLKIFYYISIMLTPLILFFTEKHKRLTYQNLDLVFNNKLSLYQKKHLLNKSMNLLILNILIALSQRFLINNNYLLKKYKKSFLPIKLKDDIKNKKILILQSHFGIFTDYSTYYNMINNLAFIYKMKNKLIENYFYKTNNFSNKLLPIKNNKITEYLNNKVNSIFINIDHKNKNSNKYNFLNQFTSFHESAANIHKITKRSIWIMIPKFNFEEISIDLEFIPVQRDYDNTPKKIITQNIADIFSKEILNSPEQYLWNFKRF